MMDYFMVENELSAAFSFQWLLKRKVDFNPVCKQIQKACKVKVQVGQSKNVFSTMTHAVTKPAG